MDIKDSSRYVRLESVVYIELGEKETMEEAEDRFMDALPDGMDIVSFKSSMWYPDEE